MLDLFGAQYVIDHCISVKELEDKRTALEYYITDALQLIGENVARVGQGKYISSTWRDLCEKTNKMVEKPKNGDEIANDVMSRAGHSFGGD